MSSRLVFTIVFTYIYDISTIFIKLHSWLTYVTFFGQNDDENETAFFHGICKKKNER